MTQYLKQHIYEIRPRKDHRGVDLVSVQLPFGHLVYVAIKLAAVLLVGANCSTRLRSQDAVNGSVIITSASEPAL